MPSPISYPKTFYSRGKLLITSEYFVLKGAKALAMPVKLGQHLAIHTSNDKYIYWKTFELNKEVFSAKIQTNNLEIIECSDPDKAFFILKIIKAAQQLNIGFLSNYSGFKIEAHIEFNMQWGLGTSSTLINNIAQWAQINPFELNLIISKGSGYDIACAQANVPLTYQITNNKPLIQNSKFSPVFIDHLSLVYLNKKMATEQNIRKFLDHEITTDLEINKISELTDQFLKCKSLDTFMQLMSEHETIVAKALDLRPVKHTLFPDFDGTIKSLGAWGGDFVLAASNNNFKKQQTFFNNKGFKTVIPLKQLMV